MNKIYRKIKTHFIYGLLASVSYYIVSPNTY